MKALELYHEILKEPKFSDVKHLIFLRQSTKLLVKGKDQEQREDDKGSIQAILSKLIQYLH